MELDSAKSSTSDLSPNSVLPHRRCSKAEKRNANGKLTRKDDILRMKEGFTDISFPHYRSSSCNMELKRGSVYQSSREVRRMKEMGSNGGRRTIELSRGSDTSFSFRIVDSLCSLDEESMPKRSPARSVNSNSNSKFVRRPCVEPCSSDDFIEICPNLDKREKHSVGAVRSDSIGNPNFKCEQLPSQGPNIVPSQRCSIHSQNQSLSGVRFVMYLNQVMPKTTGMPNMGRNQAFRKSLFHDFSHAAQKSDFGSQIVKKDHHHSAVVCSPVHLHGCLKLKNKHGVPFFEKKSNAAGWGLNDGNKESLMVGQMQVSCYSCSELKDGGNFDNSMVTEFVLYDNVYTRQRVSTEDSPEVRPDIGAKPGLRSSNINLNMVFDRGDFDSSNPYPWAAAVLHPDLEIAAIVIQLPFAKRESLKYKRRDKDGDLVEAVTVVAGIWPAPLPSFGNPGIQCAEDEPLLDNQRPLELFLQGMKENNIPAMTMTVLEEGQYAVDFHAQLSTLQAFSICVAILHGTKATGVIGEERGNRLSHCDSLKMLIKEEVKFFIEGVTEEEKRKASKKVEGIKQSYVLNPPFSPIARV
ncbi:hypothetical protein OIU74_014552 [Salix koriyanagi]|uniref:Uncharacterized protein n=1 Tax=Salix koriyanagi TaxID=2511006 RepID=A0A9Q0PWL1_9ROSI|nr:hypothetical protein OIU74_014552 [Salix koriyanagi]